MKKCPFCAEEIQDDAIKCRYCGEFLTGLRPQSAGEERPLPWYFSTTTIVVALLSVGPLVLPLIWFHPRYSVAAKIVWTVAVSALTVWLCMIAEDIYQQLEQVLPSLGGF